MYLYIVTDLGHILPDKFAIYDAKCNLSLQNMNSIWHSNHQIQDVKLTFETKINEQLIIIS